MDHRSESETPTPDPGFSMIELLVVVSIVVIMGAVAAPNIVAFMRNYKIRGATQQVAAEITAARMKAIGKNVNHGVVFVVTSPVTYRYYIEDYPGQAGTRLKLTQADDGTAATKGMASATKALPAGIQFSTSCPGTLPAGAWDKALRFNRLGMWCDPGSSASCPTPVDNPGSTLVYNATTDAGSLICLRQGNLVRTVSVSPGGRVATQR